MADLRAFLQINNPAVSDDDLLRAHRSVQKFLRTRQVRASPWVDRELMEAESLQALWEAAQTYDPSRGASLVTHAVNLARRNFQYLYRQMWPGGQAQWNRRIDAARYAQAFDGNLDAPLELEGGERELSEDLESAAAPDDTEAMVLLRTEYERVLTACAATLTPKQQQRLLVWVETGCCGAASRELGISRGMVANSVYLALGKLRAELGVAG